MTEDLKGSRGDLRLQVPSNPGSTRIQRVRQSVVQFRANKISWLGSRLDENETPKSATASDDDKSSIRPESSVTITYEQPRFRKRETSSILELFYDLWVVATLNVFTSAHEITTRDELASFLQYIFLLWTTWFLVVIYDVRFLEDSVVERLTRAVQLGVLLVFVQAAPFFNPSEQTRGVFASLSLVLSFSRLVLAGQYGIVLWQTRYFLQGRTGLVVVLATHILAASLYALVSAAFFVNENSPAYVAWMVVSTLEIVANLIVAMMSRVVSFEGSHLPERLSQLTLVVLGEGVINLARDLTSIERNSQNSWMSWSPQMLFIFMSGIAMVYLIFQIYFDWMHPNRMTSWPQTAWALLHLPFHFALLLVMEAMNQFIIWWRLLELIRQSAADIFNIISVLPEVPTSQQVASKLNETVTRFYETYPAQEDGALATDGIAETLRNVSVLPQELWNELSNKGGGVNASFSPSEALRESLREFEDDLVELFSATIDTIFSNFELEPLEREPSGITDALGAQKEAFEVTTRMFNLVFVYAFLAAGTLVILLVLLHAASKREGWTPFNILRSVFIGVLGLALMFVTLLSTNTSSLHSFFDTPWPLPMMTLTFVIVLFLTHAPHPRSFLGYAAPIEEASAEDPGYGWPRYYNDSIRPSRARALPGQGGV
ncbi:hypothetical protein KVR01_008362 [Diaporthe batatas]|uniref:uncharacterized protein n=1 Tax=Diaporthe batatas TaxID=748121 RepID=UPI001D047263|nr:uncharacterized protein KVR01_008362 [Diaporthe batatas]KAG8162597.1 hypothetical protein KVR01_008362 [Diaporthe batatas]